MRVIYGRLRGKRLIKKQWMAEWTIVRVRDKAGYRDGERGTKRWI